MMRTEQIMWQIIKKHLGTTVCGYVIVLRKGYECPWAPIPKASSVFYFPVSELEQVIISVP
jgi:hypothetical protein